MARPKTFQLRHKTLSDGRRASYARFTDQNGQRHELLLGYDLDAANADRMLGHIRTDVERGTWAKPTKATPSDPDPTFLVFASDWLDSKKKGELSARSIEWYEWGIVDNLLPHLHAKRMSEFNRAETIENLRDALLARTWGENRPPGKRGTDKRLSARSVNAVLSILSGILETAWRRDLVTKNWASDKQLRATTRKRAKVGTWLDYEPLVALLDAAQEIDLGTQRGDARNQGRRALLACMFLGGMRVSEATRLTRRDVNWKRGTLQVVDSKTPAGYRYVTMHRMLFDVMTEWWMRAPQTKPSDLLFPNLHGNAHERNNVRERVLKPARIRAAELLQERRSDQELPESFATHAGRRTAITWWAEAGYDEREVMGWVGHEDAALTIRLYRQARNRPNDRRVVAAMAQVPEHEKNAPRKGRPS